MLLAALRKISSGRENFTSQEIFPLFDEAGDEVPSYQAYLVLSWLKNESIITQLGRSGYVFADDQLPNDKIRERWDSLQLLDANS